MTNSIIANSLANGDCMSSGTVTGSHNLIEDAAQACGLAIGTNSNILGLDPILGPLTDNGGSTLTYAPLASSFPSLS